LIKEFVWRLKLNEKEKLFNDYLESWKVFMGADREVKKSFEKIEIQIGDVNGTAALLEEQASKLCAAFKQRLPVKGYFMHAVWGGEMVRKVKDLDLGQEATLENGTYFVCPGDVLYTPYKELGICYGEASPRTPWGLLKVNIFARIVGNFKEIQKECIRIRLEGAKKFTLQTLKEDY